MYWINKFKLVLLVLAAGVIGCDSGGDREAVSGKVTLDGAALEGALVTFEPANLEAGGSPSAATTDSQGQYTIPAEKGLPAGEYKVKISKSTGGGEVDPEAAPGDSSAVKPAEETIPSEYNVNTKLTASVKAGEENTFPFELKGK